MRKKHNISDYFLFGGPFQAEGWEGDDKEQYPIGALYIDKIQQTGGNLGRVFNFRCGCEYSAFKCYEVKLPNLKLKTGPKQLL